MLEKIKKIRKWGVDGGFDFDIEARMHPPIAPPTQHLALGLGFNLARPLSDGLAPPEEDPPIAPRPRSRPPLARSPPTALPRYPPRSTAASRPTGRSRSAPTRVPTASLPARACSSAPTLPSLAPHSHPTRTSLAPLSHNPRLRPTTNAINTGRYPPPPLTTPSHPSPTLAPTYPYPRYDDLSVGCSELRQIATAAQKGD